MAPSADRAGVGPRTLRMATRGLRVLRHPSAIQLGRCPICGHATAFVLGDASAPRETLSCIRCKCVPRNRLVALEILERLGSDSLREAAQDGLTESIYIAAAYGPLLVGLPPGTPGLTTSDFVPGVAVGELLDDGVSTCQNLEQMTFPDQAFDIVVTEDVLEHVRDPDRALREVFRVLRPGGVHVFTVPMLLDAPGFARVDTSGPDDVLLMEPEWHGDAVRGRILAYRVFGYDLFARLDELGFVTRLRLPRHADRRSGVLDAFALVSQRPFASHCG